MSRVTCLLACVALACSTLAQADDAAKPDIPADQAAALAPDLPKEALDTVPAMACEKPKIPQRASMPEDDIHYFLEKVRAYTACVSAYITERQTQMRKYNDLARAHAQTGNAVAQDVNLYQGQVKEFLDKHMPKKQ